MAIVLVVERGWNGSEHQGKAGCNGFERKSLLLGALTMMDPRWSFFLSDASWESSN
jgi:hypothetical protein